MVYTKEELEAIAKVVVDKDIYVIADEMYEHLIYGGEVHVSIASLNDEIFKRTITCSGVSKSYSMTGWRIGYTGSTKEIAKLMSSVQSHQTSNPNSIAQKAAYEALVGPQDFVYAMRDKFETRLNYMVDRVKDMEYISVVKPHGAFYLFVDISKTLDKSYKGQKVGNVDNLAKILIENYQVAVISCDDFGFDDHIRLSYAISLDEIEKGLDRIDAFLKELA